MNSPSDNGTFAVPDGLSELDQWVLWRMETVDGRQAKVPYSVGGYRASTTKPRDWAPFDHALSTWRDKPHQYTGLGFVFSTEDGLAGVDLDDALDERGEVKVWAREIVEVFSDTYMEVSPSWRGLKIWARGSLPANLPGVQVGDGAVELYDHARYFTVTGRALRGAPLQIEEHSKDLVALYTRLAGDRKTGPLQPQEGGRIPYGQQHNTLAKLLSHLKFKKVPQTAPALPRAMLSRLATFEGALRGREGDSGTGFGLG